MRRIIGLLAIAGLVASALAQGTVAFQNRVFITAVDRLVRNVDGAPLVGTDFVAQLWFGTQGTPENSLTPVSLAPVPFRPATTTLPGVWQSPSALAVLPGVVAGRTATLQVRVWNLAAFPTYQAAVSGGGVRGASALFDYVTLGSGSEVWTMEEFRGFRLIPEPSPFALVVVGSLALLLQRTPTSPSCDSRKASNQSRQPTPGSVLREDRCTRPGAAALNRSAVVRHFTQNQR